MILTKKLMVVILVLGPIISYILWMMFGSYIRIGIAGYILTSVIVILFLVYWAWMGKPPMQFA